MNNNNPLVKKSDKLALLVYKAVREFPKDEIFGLSSQLKRAVLSVPLNIIEGYSRKTSQAYQNFLYIAYGSLKETKYLLYFAHRENYIEGKHYKEITELAEEVGKMLWTSIKTINKKIDNYNKN